MIYLIPGSVMVFRVYGVVCAGFLVLFVLVNLYNRNEGSFSAELADEIDPTVHNWLDFEVIDIILTQSKYNLTQLIGPIGLTILLKHWTQFWLDFRRALTQFIFYNIKGNVGVFVCLFSIEIQTTGRIRMKFGMEVVLKGGKVLGFFDPVSPTPGVQGASGASAMRFG